MIKISNKLVIFGAVAAAALVVPSVLGLGFQAAYADHRPTHIDQSQNAINNAENALVQAAVAAQVAVDADVDNNEVRACVIVERC